MDKLEYITLRTLVHLNTIRELKNSSADWKRPTSQPPQRPVSGAVHRAHTGLLRSLEATGLSCQVLFTWRREEGRGAFRTIRGEGPASRIPPDCAPRGEGASKAEEERAWGPADG